MIINTVKEYVERAIRLAENHEERIASDSQASLEVRATQKDCSSSSS